ncbi:DUF3352 domain-containing protein [Bacteroides sp. 224]|uniref:DUF3352 domain-containing protein n=1 Tax=Bacteroides sp. 224 TaxID=2302936 RepID=UPI0013D41852|nr:DUF3352 domain-containing protein [Bacteroides sp. 224]NDV65771.1 DUF3352 domain-containing protein [Bacteroides sp. 224]
MKLRLILRTAVITCVMLLCVGFVASWYFEINDTEKSEDFDLYTLVPPTALAVIDTDDVVQLMQGINELQCSKDGHFLYFSQMFSHLKAHINTLLDETPHGLSRQMSKMLISFHEPDNMNNQVFYSRLGSGDRDFIDRFIQKHCASMFTAKQFEYKGEEIKIYPLVDDSFLACYFGPGYMALSSEKRLIEEVIDALVDKRSILNDSAFQQVRSSNRGAVLPANIYMKADSIFDTWTEFSTQMNTHALYFSGVSYEADKTDTCHSFTNKLRYQTPVERFPGDILPASTFLFSKRSASDLQPLFDFIPTESSLVTCFFHAEDSVEKPSVIVSIPVKDEMNARRSFSALMATAPERINNTFVTLTGVTSLASSVCSEFYDGRLIMAADSISLNSYMSAMEKGDIMVDHNPLYQESTSSLSHSYNFIMMADLEDVFSQPAEYMQFMPEFFFRHKEFFRHFLLSTQIICTDGVIYPNIVLIYKGVRE